jgi:hypothetical protein
MQIKKIPFELEKWRRIAWQPTIESGIGFLIGLQRIYNWSCNIEEKTRRRVSLAAIILCSMGW